jgi:hypothetical protein
MWKDKSEGEKSLGDLIDSLLNATKRHSASGEVDYDSDTLNALERLREIKPVWKIDLHKTSSDSLDRKGSFFGGLPFTSDDYPWPVNSESRPLCPLVQLDLREITKITGEEFGDGLLQVWVNLDEDKFLTDLIRIVDVEELSKEAKPAPCTLAEIIGESSWQEISLRFTLSHLGYMCGDWSNYQVQCLDDSREFGDDEWSLIEEIQEIVKENNYKGIDGDWLLGFPDRGSSAPAGRYDPEPRNFLQFATSDTFPMVSVSRYANIFYWRSANGSAEFTFDWNG